MFNKLPILSFRNILRLVVLFVIYFISAKLGLKLAFVNASATAIWPPTGIAIAAFLLFGEDIWPAIFLGAFLTNITTAGTIITSIIIASGNTLEGLIGAYLVNKYAGGTQVFDRVRNIFLFTIFAAFLATLLSATIGVTGLTLAGFSDWGSYISVWQTWWFGDASGALIIAPLIILWMTKPFSHWRLPSEILETLIFLAVVMFTGVVVFSGVLAYPYLCIPVLMWIAFRFGQRAGVTGVFLLSIIAVWYTVHGFGPYAREAVSINQSLVLVQFFLGTVAVTTLILAALVAEKRRTQERLNSSLDNMREGFQIIGFDWCYLYVNDAVVKQGKSSREELLGHTMMEKYPGIDKTELFTHLRRCMEDRVAHEMETEFVFPDGSKAWFELRIEPISDGISILSLDIDERKRSEEKLTREKAEDEALLASIGDGIIATDKNGKIILVNKAFEDLLGWKKDEVLENHTVEFIKMQDEKGKDLPDDQRPLRLAFKTGKKITVTNYLVRRDGTKFPALIVATPIIFNKEIIGAIKVFHDVTREKEIDRAKTEFVSLASHQLRTPPSIVKWYSELLLNNPDYPKFTDKQKIYIKEISEAGERMIVLVNTLLNVSRLELGTFKTQSKSVDIIQIAKNSLTELASDIKTKKLQVQEIYEEKLPKITTDPGVVTIVLQNLLSNAVKYTPDNGKIVLKILSEKNKIIITVTDTGYGIPQDQQAKIFTKLFRADNVSAKDTQGNGLGLYIARSILERINGKISFKSTENKGTTFTVSILNRKKGR